MMVRFSDFLYCLEIVGWATSCKKLLCLSADVSFVDPLHARVAPEKMQKKMSVLSSI